MILVDFFILSMILLKAHVFEIAQPDYSGFILNVNNFFLLLFCKNMNLQKRVVGCCAKPLADTDSYFFAVHRF